MNIKNIIAQRKRDQEKDTPILNNEQPSIAPGSAGSAPHLQQCTRSTSTFVPDGDLEMSFSSLNISSEEPDMSHGSNDDPSCLSAALPLTENAEGAQEGNYEEAKDSSIHELLCRIAQEGLFEKSYDPGLVSFLEGLDQEKTSTTKYADIIPFRLKLNVKGSELLNHQ